MDSQKKADSLRFLFLHTKRTRPFQAGPFVYSESASIPSAIPCAILFR